MKEPFIIKRDKKHLYKTLILQPVIVFFALNGAYKLFQSESTFKLVFAGFLCLISLVFIATIIKSLLSVFDKSPALIINDEGMIDNVSVAKVGLIKWQEIVDINLAAIGGGKVIVIHVLDNEKFLEGKSEFKKQMLQVAIQDSGSCIMIHLKEINIKPSYLIEMVKNKLSN